jgi:hypothetical protein
MRRVAKLVEVASGLLMRFGCWGSTSVSSSCCSTIPRHSTSSDTLPGGGAAGGTAGVKNLKAPGSHSGVDRAGEARVVGPSSAVGGPSPTNSRTLGSQPGSRWGCFAEDVGRESGGGASNCSRPRRRELENRPSAMLSTDPSLERTGGDPRGMSNPRPRSGVEGGSNCSPGMWLKSCSRI